jgi:hypothetical protein
MLVEREAGKRHTSHVIRFLQTQVGYAANDSAFQLSSTGAGVRFLSLAAALLCTSSTFTAAQAIEIMVKATASGESASADSHSNTGPHQSPGIQAD